MTASPARRQATGRTRTKPSNRTNDTAGRTSRKAGTRTDPRRPPRTRSTAAAARPAQLPAYLCDDPAMAVALATRDVGSIYRFLQSRGISQRDIAAYTGQAQSEVSEILKGRKVLAYDVLERIADGLGIPRGRLGLAYQDQPTAGAAVVPNPPPTILNIHDYSAITVIRWTGRHVYAFRVAIRMSVREFARYLGVSLRVVSTWEAGGTAAVPRPVNQALFDTCLSRAAPDVQRRFAAVLESLQTPAEPDDESRPPMTS